MTLPTQFRGLLLLLWLAPAVSAMAGDRTLPEVDVGMLEKIGRQHPDQEVIIAGVVFSAELEHHEGSEGFRGRIVWEWEGWLRTRSVVKRNSRITISSSDIRHLDEVEVELRSLDGLRRKTFKQGDLDWVDASRSQAGIVSLDTEKEQAVVPSLRAGDLLYVRQVIKVKGMHGLPAVTLGNEDVPVLFDTYNLSLPLDHELEVSIFSEDETTSRVDFSSEEQGSRRMTSWRLVHDQDHPDDEVRVTPQVFSVEGKSPGKSFTVGGTWAGVGQRYRQRISPYLEPDQGITVLATELTAACETDSQRAAVLYDHLQNSTRYLGFYDGLDGIIPEPAKSVHERGYGDCKGLAAYLIAMLTSVGIEAHPVLVRTGSLGPLDPEVPNMTQFNHMIAWADVGPEGMWLDATVDHCPAGMIVAQDAASEVLLLRSGHEGLRTIPSEAWQAGSFYYSVEGEMGTDYRLECTITLASTGLAATWQRRYSHQKDGGFAKAVERFLVPRSIGMRVVEQRAAENEGNPVWTCQTRSESPVPHGGKSVYLPFVLPPMPRLQDIEDVSRESNRMEEWSVILPDGWKVAEEELTVDAGAVVWLRRIWQEEGRLRLVRELTWSPAGMDSTDYESAIEEIIAHDSGFLKINTN